MASAGSSSSNPSISPAEMQYILEGCEANIRLDGRFCSDSRPYIIDVSPLLLSNGSARVSLLDRSTDIICSVKGEIVKPTLAKPNQGIVEVSVDFLGGISNKKRRTKEMELSQLLTHLLTNAVNLKQLSVVAGKYCWKLYVDLLVLACDGNAVDASSLAVYAALNSTFLPTVTPVEKADGVHGSSNKAGDDFMIDSDILHASVPPGAKDCPITITVCRMGNKMVIDCRTEEEVCASAKTTVSVDCHGTICGVNKCGSGSMPFRQLGEVTGMAVTASETMFQKCLNSILERANDNTASGTETILCSHVEFK